MILYKKTFPLGKGMSFSRYIEILDKKSFSPYTLLIKKMPKTEKARIEIVLNDIVTILRLGWSSGGAFGNVLFSDIVIKKSGEQEFTIEGSIGVGNLLLLSLYIVGYVTLSLFILYVIIARNMPIGDMFVALLVFSIVLYPLGSIYFRERKLLKIIGSLGSDTNE